MDIYTIAIQVCLPFLLLIWLPDDYIRGFFSDAYWHHEYSIIKNNAEWTSYRFLVVFGIVNLLLNSNGNEVYSHHWPANTLSRNGITPSAHTMMITHVCWICIPNYDILQGSSRLCNWLYLRYLRCLVSWINNLTFVCWSTFGSLILDESWLVSWHNGKLFFIVFNSVYTNIFAYTLTSYNMTSPCSLFALFPCLK